MFAEASSEMVSVERIRQIGNRFIFQHDNDPKHTAGAVKAYHTCIEKNKK